MKFHLEDQSKPIYCQLAVVLFRFGIPLKLKQINNRNEKQNNFESKLKMRTTETECPLMSVQVKLFGSNESIFGAT